jgi:hypothetical protein
MVVTSPNCLLLLDGQVSTSWLASSLLPSLSIKSTHDFCSEALQTLTSPAPAWNIYSCPEKGVAVISPGETHSFYLFSLEWEVVPPREATWLQDTALLVVFLTLHPTLDLPFCLLLPCPPPPSYLLTPGSNTTQLISLCDLGHFPLPGFHCPLYKVG